MDSPLTQMVSMALALFLLMDSIGNVPIFISVLKNVEPKKHSKIILRELFIALVIIIAFQLAGQFLLNLLQVSMPTLQISGGIILFMLAIKMVFPIPQPEETTALRMKDPFIVPLATPLVAGPAVLAAVMLYSGQGAPRFVTIGAIVIAWAASTIILLAAPLLRKALGSRGLVALERLMGLVLTLIAVQMFLDGLHLFLGK